MLIYKKRFLSKFLQLAKLHYFLLCALCVLCPLKLKANSNDAISSAAGKSASANFETRFILGQSTPPGYSESINFANIAGYIVHLQIAETNVISNLSAALIGDDILLQWSAVTGATCYNVYRGTSFDFVPDLANGTNRIALEINDEDPNSTGIQWTDAGNGADIVGDININYFWRITAIRGTETGPSNVVGEYDYSLITTSGTDINELSVVMDAQLTTAEELAQSIPNCTDVYYWDAAGQGTVGHVKGLPFNNFAVSRGYPYIVNVSSPTIWTLTGGYEDVSFNFVTTNGTDINHLTIPLGKSQITNAEALGQDIPNCTDVYYWDAAGQGTVGHVVGLPFGNFAVTAGKSYYVNVSAPTVWPTGSVQQTMLAKTINKASEQQIQHGLVRGGIPHTVFGKLRYAESDEVTKGNLSIRAWITSRSSETLTDEVIGTGHDGEYWWISVSNFETKWSVGESLFVQLNDPELGLQGETTVILSDKGSDDGGEICLAQPVVVSDAAMRDIPKEFALLPNYPNPFNPETIIAYGLAEACNVKLSIYDLLGRKVCELVNENQHAGWYQVVWNGWNENRLSASSGTYFVKLETQKVVKIAKILLLK